ncbi:biotin--[acetyl-CoA-carboxylase] ligase [Flagellatimonas centrodinii]|uniref:biotin--[acetyl-CoA-carboxylase] ligase n=1 Tax=Flagellatimonas centrodinii TaxID=2806210 RepID=UPI001FEF3C6F|nr:biotin--[acetyl-CoA-carboxylase] ligase [Flagellatimonas centrodinii]ULQ45254.1 biotin--[acetyl-CoA-carboxylase] ligase [Flagellatimonas centrodinii]
MAEPLNPGQHRALVGALADGDWHSGADLSETFGISRAALGKRIDALGAFGLQVERRHGTGYRLQTRLDLLDTDAIATPAGWRLELQPVTGSTNSDLLARDAAEDPQALLAEYQQGGRGRRGRQWVSPFGHSLMLSAAWSFPTWPRDLGCLPLAVGVCAAEALAGQGIGEVLLKWPNDLYARGRKLGGILLEHRGETGGACRIVIGIGLNVRPFADGQAPDQPWIAADQLRDTPVDRNALAAALLSQLAAMLAAYADTGFAPWRGRWQARDLTLDRKVNVLGPGAPWQGIARGIDTQGALQVEVDGQLKPLHSGEVSVRMETPR